MTQSYLYGNQSRNGLTSGAFLFWFVIIVLAVWILLRSFNPAFIQYDNNRGQANGNFDPAKALFAAIVIAIIILFLVCFFTCACRR